MVTGVLSREESGQSMNLTTHPHLGQMLRRSEATLTHLHGVDTQNFTFFYLVRKDQVH